MQMVMNTHDTLMVFSEWMDSPKTCTTTDDGMKHDPRCHYSPATHDDLAKAFIEYWNENPGRARLAGSEPFPVNVQVEGAMDPNEGKVDMKVKNPEFPCPTPMCPGDARISASRMMSGHLEGCTNPNFSN